MVQTQGMLLGFIGKELRDDPELRAVIVAGKGRAFSSGIDTTVFTAGSADSIEDGDDAARQAKPLRNDASQDDWQPWVLRFRRSTKKPQQTQ